MKTLVICLIFSVLVSIFAYLCMGEQAKNAHWVMFVDPFGMVLGFVIAFQGVLKSKKNEALLGLVQLSFWSLYGFFLAILPTPPNVFLQILLITLITLYLGASLTFFGMAYFESRRSEKSPDAAPT
jgi:hypothetical protein